MQLLLGAVVALAGSAAQAPLSPSTLRIVTDSSRKEIRIEYRVSDAPPSHGAHAHHGGGGHAGHVQRMVRFQSPITGWFRGAHIDLEGPGGEPISQKALHHLNLINLSRRQLIHGGVERMWAAGPETEATVLPAGVGMPVSREMMLAMVVAYMPEDMPPGSLVRLRLSWTPRNVVPAPVDIFPLAIDVNYKVAESAAYDLPAGRSERSFEFVMPIEARMLGVGGHMHDYGESLRLEDVETGRVVFELRARKDAAGMVQGIPREVYGVAGRGRKLEQGRRYRLVATYDNPTGKMIPLGGMGEVGIGLTVEDPEQWPALDRTDPDIAGDLANLESFEER